MVATADQINTAKSTINYFYMVLKGSENDIVKALVVATRETKANRIVGKIKEAEEKKAKGQEDASSVAIINAARKLAGRSNLDSYQEEDFKKDVAKVLKGYDFVDSILKNIPYQAKDVLTSSGNTFDNFKFPLSVDNLNIAKIYTKISGAVAGTGPFVGAASGGDIPEPEAQHGRTKHTPGHHVSESLKQFNKIAYFLLSKTDCGSNRLDCYEVKESCYKAIAEDVKGLYPGVDVTPSIVAKDVDKMNIDLSGEYQYEKMFEGTELHLPKVKKGRPDHEVSECLRAKKKEAEEGIERVVRATDVMEGVDAEAIRYNKEALDKVVDKIEQRRKEEVLDDNKKKEMDDWFIYAKKEMEAKDSEIERLKAELERGKLDSEGEELAGFNPQEYEGEL
jgi:hypothetical protein